MNVLDEFGLMHWPNCVIYSELFTIVTLECALRHPVSHMAISSRIKLNTKLYIDLQFD
jgi:hypothetical protein